MDSIDFTLNGERLNARGFDPHVTLLEYLRERGLTGTKEGCAEGECGACAVVLVRRHADGGTRYEPVNSCLLLLAGLAGAEVITVEGVARGAELHPVQAAMVAEGGSQCGYCTPGFVMSLFAEYYRPGRDAFEMEAIAGNLCRCTGYRPIRDAAQKLGKPKPGDRFAQRLNEPAPESVPVEYAGAVRRFFRPTTLRAALDVLAREAGVTIVAGGTDVVVDMNQKHVRFDALLALDAVEELRAFTWHDDALEIGAGVPLAEVEARVPGKLPLLEQLFPLFSSRLIRNRATFGGNLATASPIGDGPPALLALDAELRLASAAGERRVPLGEFFTDYRKTALRAGEIIVSVRVPLPVAPLTRFYKVSKRVLDDISTVAAAFAFDVDARGVVTRARLAYGGVAATPVRALAAEAALVGQPWNARAVERAKAGLEGVFSPIDDHRGSAAYRRAMVTRLFDKFCAETSSADAAAAQAP
jgi:xanthine dehydrogenase small subunit